MGYLAASVRVDAEQPEVKSLSDRSRTYDSQMVLAKINAYH